MKINNAYELKTAIAILESEKQIKKQELNDQFKATLHGLNPINLVKNAMKTIDAPEMINDLISASVGAGAGVLSKKILIGKPTNFLKRILGKAVQFAVSSVVTKKI